MAVAASMLQEGWAGKHSSGWVGRSCVVERTALEGVRTVGYPSKWPDAIF